MSLSAERQANLIEENVKSVMREVYEPAIKDMINDRIKMLVHESVRYEMSQIYYQKYRSFRIGKYSLDFRIRKL